MRAIAAFLLVLCHLSITQATLNCREAPRLYNVRQIDAGQGKVVATDTNSYAYFLIGSTWHRLSTTRFRHVSAGPAGLWGCGTNNRVYKYVAGNFLQSSGQSMLQVDAGGDDQVVGVTTSYSAYCLRSSSALTYRGVGSLSWRYMSRRFRYQSCSPNNGCWGVDTRYRVYHTQRLTESCGTSGWRSVSGLSMRMVEVGTDGSVFGVTTGGQVYKRVGISSGHRQGTSWSPITMCMAVRHLSYDLGRLWVVTNSGFVMQCTPDQGSAEWQGVSIET